MAVSRTILAATVLVIAAGRGLAQSESYKPDAGGSPITTRLEIWRDEARGRDVPVKVYVPGSATSEARAPVVVFSHGMGGSREGYEYLSRHLASHGYLVIHPTHKGSDTEAIRGEFRRRIRDRLALGDGAEMEPAVRPGAGGAGGGVIARNTSDPENLRNRPGDVAFVLDHVAADPALCAIADLERVAVAGHSFGSYTAMACAGMLVDLPGAPDASFREERIKAAIAMSPQGTGAMGVDAGAWAGIEIPVLYLTGTKDYGQGERPAAWRREAFDASVRPDQYFVCITDATHMTFADNAGLRLRPGAKADPRHAEHIGYVRMAALAFLDAHVRDDAAARVWLASDALRGLSAGAAPIERRGTDSTPEP